MMRVNNVLIVHLLYYFILPRVHIREGLEIYLVSKICLK